MDDVTGGMLGMCDGDQRQNCVTVSDREKKEFLKFNDSRSQSARTWIDVVMFELCGGVA